MMNYEKKRMTGTSVLLVETDNQRMREKAEQFLNEGKNVVADFVCPTQKQEKVLMLILLYG